MAKLNFDEKKPPSKLAHVTAETPVDALAIQFHREMRESDDNAGTSAMETGVSVAETVYHAERSAQYSRKMKESRNSVRETAETFPKSKLQQKKSIKQQYADAKRKSDNTTTTSEVAAKAVEKVTEQARRTVRFVRSHSRMFVIVFALLAVLMVFMSMISSCAMIFQGVLGSMSSSTTYPGDAADMAEVETAYCGMEAELQEILDDYEDSGCIVNGSVPGHDPYVLTAILSAVYGEYTLSDVQTMLELLFEMQYELTEEDVIFYDEIVCVVTLEYTPMEDLLDDLLTEEQREQYEIYMETQGNYPDLFPVE
ncbi:MAG: hypothetical protein IKI93_17845 [Clostridia bacterium]|nr:hypothetical protein [Clostridia bacterium]